MSHSLACSLFLGGVVSIAGVRLIKRQRNAGSVPKTESSCASTTDWNDASFQRCDFWGDPHYDRTFYQNSRVDNHQLGVIEVAKSAEGNLHVQNFQCTWGKRAAISYGSKMRLDGVDIYVSGNNVTVNGRKIDSLTEYPNGIDAYGELSSNEGVSFISASQCNRFNVNRKQGEYLNAKIRVKGHKHEGICGKRGVQPKVPRNKILFTSAEINAMCVSCTRGADASRWPPECGGPNENPPVPTPGEICSDANIPLSRSQQKCDPLKGTDTFDGCVIDYCGSGGDESVIANAIEEPLRQPIGHWWWGQGMLTNGKISSKTYSSWDSVDHARGLAVWACAKDKACMGVVHSENNRYIWHTVYGGGTRSVWSYHKYGVGFFGCGWYTYGPLVFVIDKSLSMGRRVNGGLTRDEMAYNQLELALNSLTYQVYFNVIYYSDSATKVFASSKSGTSENVKTALDAVKNHLALGSTNTYAAMDMALDVALDARNSRGKILFLSDGQPTGKSEQEILNLVKRKSHNWIPIDGIVMTKSFSTFMFKLSKQTKGMYRSVRV